MNAMLLMLMLCTPGMTISPELSATLARYPAEANLMDLARLCHVDDQPWQEAMKMTTSWRFTTEPNWIEIHTQEYHWVKGRLFLTNETLTKVQIDPLMLYAMSAQAWMAVNTPMGFRDIYQSVSVMQRQGSEFANVPKVETKPPPGDGGYMTDANSPDWARILKELISTPLTP